MPADGARRRADGVRELLRVDLVEVALTIQPANVEALLTSVKHASGAALSDDVEERAMLLSARINLALVHRQLDGAR